MITLYGIVSSRASRNMWMLNELGLEYRVVPIDDRIGETRSAEFLAINPNGKVPYLIDGDTGLCESIAINLYLANKYRGELWYDDVEQQGQAMQWSIWALMEIDENMMKVFTAASETQREHAFGSLFSAANVIDRFLDRRDYLIGDRFSAADLNAAACFSGGAFMNIGFREFGSLFAWLERCYTRPRAAIAGSSIDRFRALLC
jgi:glutathione S-transferase